MPRIETVAELRTLYGAPVEAALVKVADHLTAEYQVLIANSPFAALATAGPDGLDCSPRGDRGAVVHVRNERLLVLPDRRGNNRTDSLENILHDQRVALLFLIPGSGTTLRVNGQAYLETDAALCAEFAVEGAAPRCLIMISVAAVYFQCARAIVRSDLWNPARHVAPACLPTPGQILATMSAQGIDGDDYDRRWPARAQASLW
jgi:PPOX class probable FMN-dependent enzyme